MMDAVHNCIMVFILCGDDRTKILIQTHTWNGVLLHALMKKSMPSARIDACDRDKIKKRNYFLNSV
jgi:hypothetical protein